MDIPRRARALFGPSHVKGTADDPWPLRYAPERGRGSWLAPDGIRYTFQEVEEDPITATAVTLNRRQIDLLMDARCVETFPGPECRWVFGLYSSPKSLGALRRAGLARRVDLVERATEPYHTVATQLGLEVRAYLLGCLEPADLI